MAESEHLMAVRRWIVDSKAAQAGLSALVMLLVTIARVWGQEPKAATPSSANTASPNVGQAAAGKAVDVLVEQLRRYPARPSTATGQVGLFLIDAEGGTATLIANEPDPWLNRCGSSAWSHDGKQILFDVAAGGGTLATVSRLKVLDLADGRLELRDLGGGGSPDWSPSDDRIIFILNPGAVPGATGGVWLMNSDGSQRRLLGGSGRPKWSPDSRQFMIVGESDPCEVTIMDVRPEYSGVLRVADYSIFSMPSWAGEGTIVAAIGASAPEMIALVDVSSPEHGKVKEILWKQGSGLDVRPSFPVYSPVTRRCAFVGTEEGKGRALYSFVHTKSDPPKPPDSPKRLEQRDFDKVIQDLTSSPDGRYVVFASDRREAGPIAGHRPQSVDAPAISGITIDGDLKDWPAAMPRYPIQNMHSFPNTMNGMGRREHAFLSTSPDLSAAFSVGYDPKEQVIYLAVVVRDDQLVVGNTSSWDTDAVEVYLDGLHSETVRGFPRMAAWGEMMDAGEAPVLQYIGIPGQGPVYGVKKSAGQDRSGKDNPILMFGDINKTKTRMAFRRVGDVTTYEWALQAFDHYPDKPTKLLPGVQIGFDVVVADKDKPAQTPLAQDDPEEDRQSWICWGPPWRRLKFFDAANLGEIVLGRNPGP
jgi:hypothetical protein